MKTITVNELMAQELLDWAEGERHIWPPNSAFQDDLERLIDQLRPVAGVEPKGADPQ